MRKNNKKMQTNLLSAVTALTVAASPITLTGTMTALSIAAVAGLADAVHANEMQDVVDNIAEGKYTITQKRDLTSVPVGLKDALIAVKQEDGTYKYKKFTGAVDLATIRTAYKNNEFAAVDVFKPTYHLPDTATIYVLQHAQLMSDDTRTNTSVFQHREEILFNPFTNRFGFLVRAGQFNIYRYEKVGQYKWAEGSKYKVPGEQYDNNSLIFTHSALTANLLLSKAPSMDLVADNNLVLLGENVDIIFKEGPESVTPESIRNKLLRTSEVGDETDGYETVVEKNADFVDVEWKYVVKNGENIVNQDAEWRKTRIYYSDGNEIKFLPKKVGEYNEIVSSATFWSYLDKDRVPNNFANYIVDDLDFSALPGNLKNQALASEQVTPNHVKRGYENLAVVPQDGALSNFVTPEPCDGHECRGPGWTSTMPARHIPYNKIATAPHKYTESKYTYPNNYGEEEPTLLNPATEEIFEPAKLRDVSDIVYAFDSNDPENEKQDAFDRYWEFSIQATSFPTLDLNNQNLTVEEVVTKALGDVKVNYYLLDENGNPTNEKIRDSRVETESALIETPYSLVDNDEKPDPLEKYGIRYKLVTSKKKENSREVNYEDTGKVVKGETVVDHYYAPIQEEIFDRDINATLTIKYYVGKADYFNELSTEEEEIPRLAGGYVHKTGKIGTEKVKKTYYVNDKNEKIVLEEKVIAKQITGMPYDVNNDAVTPGQPHSDKLNQPIPVEFLQEVVNGNPDDYKLRSARTMVEGADSLSGTMVNDITVKAFYEPASTFEEYFGTEEFTRTKTAEETGTLIIRYVDEDGNEIALPYTDKDNVVVEDTTYDIRCENLTEETVNNPSNEGGYDGDWTAAEQANCNFNTRYNVRTNSRNVPYSIEDNKQDGTPIKPQNIGDYNFAYIAYNESPTGILPKGTKTITLVYKKNQGDVLFRYENEAGQKIANDYMDTALTILTNPVQTYDANGTKGDGTQEKPTDIVGFDGKEYTFTRVKTGEGLSEESGQLKAGRTTVVFVYREKTTTSSVTIQYKSLDANGEYQDSPLTLEDNYAEATNVNVGESYKLEGARSDKPSQQEKPTSIVKDGVTYTLVEAKTTRQVGNAQAETIGAHTEGVVASENTIITYYYKPEAPQVAQGSVVIKYKALKNEGETLVVDEAVTLRQDYQDLNNVPVTTAWNTKETQVDHDQQAETAPVDEMPLTLSTTATDSAPSVVYKLVSERTTVQKPTDTDPVLIQNETELEGQVVEGTTVVTYYYAPVKANVIVKYRALDAQGEKTDTELETDYTDTANAVNGTSYTIKEKRSDDNNKDEKPSRLTKNGVTYLLVEDKTTKQVGTETATQAVAGENQDYAGTVATEDTVITFYYKPTGNVIVKYKALNEAGTEVVDSITLSADYKDTTEADLNTNYTIEGKKPNSEEDEKRLSFEVDGTTYNLVANKTTKKVGTGNEEIVGENYNGTVAAGDTVITFFYQPVAKGSVVIKYKALSTDKQSVDNSLNLKNDHQDVTNVNVGTEYSIVDEGEKPESFTVQGENGEQYTYRLETERTTKQVGEATATTTTESQGTVTPGTTTYTYYYAPVLGNVTIKYKALNTAGEVDETTILQGDYQDAANVKAGSSFNAEEDNRASGGVEEKPTTFTKRNPDGSTTTYRLERTETVINDVKQETPSTSGTVTEGNTVITYFYKPVPKGSVVIDYKILGTDQSLQDRYNDLTNVDVGTAYNVAETDIDHDKLDTTPAIAERPALINKTNDDGSVTPYRLVETETTKQVGGAEAQKVSETTGVVEAGETVITYYYEPVKGNVYVEYKALNEDGTTVDESVVLRERYTDSNNVNVGTSYDATQTGIDHDSNPETEAIEERPSSFTVNGKTYRLVQSKTNGNPTGRVTEEPTTITYYYAEEKKKDVEPVEISASVIVNYKEQGTDKVLKPSYTDTNATVIKRGKTEVTYYMVDGREVELDRQVIEPSLVEPAVNYDTTETKDGGVEEKPNTIIEEATQTTYKLVSGENGIQYVKGSAESGRLTEDVEITYYYTAVPKGKVTVKYQTKEGTPVKEDYEDTPLTDITETPTEYRVEGENEKPRKITKDNGDGTSTTYHFVERKEESDPETGTVTKPNTEVIYIYAPEQTRTNTDEKKASVLVHFKEYGNESNVLKETRKDVDQEVIRRTTTTTKFYEGVNGAEVVLPENEQPEPEVVNLTVEYNTEANEEERPLTLTQGEFTYHLVADARQGKPQGTLTEDVEVTYFYAKEKEERNVVPNVASVTVHYRINGVDGDAGILKNPVTNTDRATISNTVTVTKYIDGPNGRENKGTPSVTTEDLNVQYSILESEKPETLTKQNEDGSTTTYRRVRGEGAENGKLERDTVVTYYYEPVTETTPTPPEEPTPTPPVNPEDPGTPTPPTTDPNQPVPPTDPNTPPVNPDNPGTTTPSNPGDNGGGETVTEKGNVIVKHYKEGTTEEVRNGRTLPEQNVGENYDVTADKVSGEFVGLDGKTYEYVSDTNNTTGNIVKGTTEVIYYYREVQKGNVVVKHLKEGTTDYEVKDSKTTENQRVGENYDVSAEKESGEFTSPKDGKKYRYVRDTQNTSGSIINGTTTVIYYYEEVPTTPPTTEPNQPVPPTDPNTPPVNPEDPGTPTPEDPGTPTPDNPGTTTPDNPGTTTPDNPGTTTPDNPGTPTPEDPGTPTPDNPGTTTPDNPGTTTPDNPGTTTPDNPGTTTPNNPGTTTPGNPGDNGGGETVTEKGNVIVKHYKEGTTEEVRNGRTLPEQNVGENYDVTADKVSGEFVGLDGKTYEYVSDTNNTTGNIVKGTTEVIYYYREVQKGNVVVKHLKDGTTDYEVKDSKTTENQRVGENYDVSAEKESGEFTSPKDGKKYRYVRDTQNTSGSIVNGTTTVIYYYEEVPTTPPTTPEETTPNTPGENNPNTPGENNPNVPGENNPNTPGENNPNVPGENNPNTPGENNPNVPGENNPNTPGENNPNVPGENNPNTPGENNPNTPGENNPNNPGTTTPNNPGTPTPEDPGTLTPPTPTTPPTPPTPVTPDTPGTTPPTGGGNTPPTGGGNTPPTGGGNTPPTGGGNTPPTGGGSTPPTGGGSTPPTGGGSTPPTGGGNTPPTGGGNTPPNEQDKVPNMGAVGTDAQSKPMTAGIVALVAGILGFFGWKKKEEEQK